MRPLRLICVIALHLSTVLAWRLAVFHPIPLAPDVNAQVAWSRDPEDALGAFSLQAIEDGALTSQIQLDGRTSDGIATLQIGHPGQLYFQIVDKWAPVHFRIHCSPLINLYRNANVTASGLFYFHDLTTTSTGATSLTSSSSTTTPTKPAPLPNSNRPSTVISTASLWTAIASGASLFVLLLRWS
ncbi:hypothetical protein FPV67DRAFT_1488809 [Lyophyllum atratum]|nr:hypothetical protein FPV67DRAFT_1488809 [Lyophyllum atratum]